MPAPANMFDLDPDEAAALAGHLDEAEQAELADLLERAVGGESLRDFIARVCPGEAPPRHLTPILEVIERARLEPVRVCISMPPGHAKTTTLLRAIVWWLLRSPADTCAYITYNDQEARAKSRVVRDLAREVGLEMVEDADSLSEWKLPEGGGLKAAGAKGSLTGKRVPGLLIYDDPYKNRQEADSPVVRGHVWSHFREAAFTRLQGGSVIVLHTRWHEDDLIGRIVRELGWEYINIAAIAEPANENAAPDPLGRAPGEAAWPEQYPVEPCSGPCGHAGHLAETRGVLGSWSWNALYQGHPTPLEGGLFKREWFRYLDDAPAEGRRCRGWDFASTDSAKADWTASARVALAPERDAAGKLLGLRVVIEHVDRLQGSPGQVETRMDALHAADPRTVDWSLPEDPGTGKFAAAYLKRRLHGRTTKSSPERGDKVRRLEPLAAQAEAGNVYLVRGPWNHAFVDELCLIPAGTNDDQADAAGRAYAELASKPETRVAGGIVVLRGR